MKRIVLLVLSMLLAISVVTPAFAEKNITVQIDDKLIAFDVQPQIINNRTMVPMRKIFETLGAYVNWNEDEKAIYCGKGSTTVKMCINDKNMILNGKIVTLDSPPCIINSRTLVPVRAIAEAFGTNVEWIEEAKKVFISTKNARKIYSDYLKRRGLKLSNGSYALGYDLNGASFTLSYYPSDEKISLMYNSGDDYVYIISIEEGEEPHATVRVGGSLLTGTFSPKIEKFRAVGSTKTVSLSSSETTCRLLELAMEYYGMGISLSDFGISY